MASRRRAWLTLQRAAVAVLGAALVAFAVAPEVSLPLFWSGVLPLLPLTFLIHPGLWRNVCPLATLGMGPDDLRSGPVDEAGARAVLVLLLLVPLRPLGLETSALASGGLLLAATAAAFAGRSRARKAGFCNSWCPILPVERLYGQLPLTEVENPRCPECTVCTPRGCLDLSIDSAAAQMLGRGRRGHGWLFSGLGGFAAAFPGVVIAFFALPPDPGALRAYGQVIGAGAASWGLCAALVRLLGLPWRIALPTLAALAAGPYAWFALGDVAVTWGVPGAAPWAGLTGATFVTLWWTRAMRRRVAPLA